MRRRECRSHLNSPNASVIAEVSIPPSQIQTQNGKNEIRQITATKLTEPSTINSEDRKLPPKSSSRARLPVVTRTTAFLCLPNESNKPVNQKTTSQTTRNSC